MVEIFTQHAKCHYNRDETKMTLYIRTLAAEQNAKHYKSMQWTVYSFFFSCFFFFPEGLASWCWKYKLLMTYIIWFASSAKRTFGHARPAKIQIRLRIRAVWSESSLGAFWIAKEAMCLHADNEDWSDCTRWVHVRRYVPHVWRLLLICSYLILMHYNMSQRTTKPTIRPVWPAKTPINKYIHQELQGFSSIPLWIAWRL